MLALTNRAADIIKQVVEAREFPQGAGLRIAVHSATDGTTAFGAKLVEAPEEEDQVVEAHGARVFLDPVASPEVDDKVLDAEVQPAGEVKFGFSQQESGDPDGAGG